jgi:hypothetical protein
MLIHHTGFSLLPNFLTTYTGSDKVLKGWIMSLVPLPRVGKQNAYRLQK